MKERTNRLKELINKKRSRSDIEKDIANPFRRVYRHTIKKAKYGDMQEYHERACSYYCNAPTKSIEEVAAEAREKMQKDLEEIWAKQAEKAAKKEAKEAEKAEKKAKKDLVNEVNKMAEENTEILHDLVDEIHEINKEADQQEEDFREVKTEDSNPNVRKGEDGLYHFSPIIIHDEEKKSEDNQPEQQEEIKAVKEPKVPQDKKPASNKGTKSHKR